MKQVINCETGEIIERKLNSNELKQQEIDETNYLTAKAVADAEAETKAAEKQAILDRIGLTADELKTILG